ncbi:MAG: DEAD/DEAH box helicase family protein [Candidatus Thiodiazotropha sp.]
MLRDLNLKQAYHKPEDDIAREFYLPCLANARHYDRAVGFFSSAVYALAWSSLREFVSNEGKIRLICSPVLSEADSNALYEGYSARAEAEQSDLITAEFRRLLCTSNTIKPARVLAALVALGIVDIQIAWVGTEADGKSRRLFHDKVGIFQDKSGGVVVFKGSMNETWAGLSLDGNLESVDVFLSWSSDRERERVEDEQEYFERLWDGQFPGVVVHPLPEVARNEIISAADVKHWEELVDEICIEINAGERWAPANPNDFRKPRPHQVAALDAWEERGRRGIFKHATGSGKTFTALCAIDDSITRGEVPIVLVPSDLLLKQWEEELRKMFGPLGLRLLICGGGNSKWRTQSLLRQWSRRSLPGGPRIILSTVQTASSDAFLSLCTQGAHIFLVADEVHRLGARDAQNILTLETGPRLGLSATPERAGDPQGTDAIFNYFEGIVPPPFTLGDAISSGALTPYAYHIHRVQLTEKEQEEWSEQTAAIKTLYARIQGGGETDQRLNDLLKNKLIQRSRIVKSAQEKVEAAVRITTKHYRRGSRWIVYCDDQEQLNEVLIALRNELGSDVYEYHTGMMGDRTKTLGLFDQAGGIVVSIRCLDEGVDIPSVDTALILASSRNPREYVQRRGRVLRRYDGKSLARVHDVLVTPRIDPEEPVDTSIIEGEIARAIEFGKSALNPSCIADLERIAIEHDMDLDKLRTVGVEEDVSDEGEST